MACIINLSNITGAPITHSIKTLRVLSRWEVSHFPILTTTLIISIRDPDRSRVDIVDPKKLATVICLDFWDIDLRSAGFRPRIGGPMDIGQANLVVDKVLEMKDSVEELIIHCEAGLSRSRGVAAGLQMLFRFNDTDLYTSGRPNAHCKSLILKSLYRGAP